MPGRRNLGPPRSSGFAINNSFQQDKLKGPSLQGVPCHRQHAELEYGRVGGIWIFCLVVAVAVNGLTDSVISFLGRQRRDGRKR